MSHDSSLHWKEIFMQAANESNREKLKNLVREAELAIFRRREELWPSSDSREELSTMAVAMAALRSIRVNELGREPVSDSAEFS
jgi:hypothetical protein